MYLIRVNSKMQQTSVIRFLKTNNVQSNSVFVIKYMDVPKLKMSLIRPRLHTKLQHILQHFTILIYQF